MTSGEIGVVLAAAGAGRRFGARKQLLQLAGRPLVHYSLDAFAAVEDVERIVLVTAAEDVAEMRRVVHAWRGTETLRPPVEVIPGGARRQDSVLRGLEALAGQVKYVLVHDAARPLIRSQDVRRIAAAVREQGAAAIGTAASDSVKRILAGRIVNELPRSEVWTVQTPQAAVLQVIREAYQLNADKDWTDEASVLRAAGVEVALVEGPRENIKITHRGDEALAEMILRVRAGGIIPPAMFRVGLGFDNHRLVPGRPLLLGGVDVPSPVGEEAHSDGDVLLHALCDALYGALGQGDIGEHFPDADPRWKDQRSAFFLERAAEDVRQAGYRLVNVDATVFLEKIKLSPYKQAIAKSIRNLLRPYWEISEDAVSIKAKTMERCDSVGRGEAIQAQVAILIERAAAPESSEGAPRGDGR